MKNNKKEKQLTISQKKELEEWEKKIESGEAYEIVEKDFIHNLSAECDPERNIKLFAKNLYPKTMIKGEKLTEKEHEEFYNLSLSYGIDNGFSMLEAVEGKYRGLLFKLRKELIKEYDCKIYSEKALVDLAISAYARNLTLTKQLTHMSIRNEITPLSNNYISVLSKDVDRANRHFITALETLKQFKQPEMKVNVKTKNAFISNNQQINNNVKQDEKKKKENIKDK